MIRSHSSAVVDCDWHCDDWLHQRHHFFHFFLFVENVTVLRMMQSQPIHITVEISPLVSEMQWSERSYPFRVVVVATEPDWNYMHTAGGSDFTIRWAGIDNSGEWPLKHVHIFEEIHRMINICQNRPSICSIQSESWQSWIDLGLMAVLLWQTCVMQWQECLVPTSNGA